MQVPNLQSVARVGMQWCHTGGYGHRIQAGRALDKREPGAENHKTPLLRLWTAI